jgi:hypothetical protein
MWWLDSADMVIVLGVIFSGCTGLTIAYCQQQRKSRCVKTSILWGCVSCEREVESDALVLAEEELERKKSAQKVTEVEENQGRI